jgi:hypothetical protein
MYVCAGFVWCLWWQNYQQWYFVSTFIQSWFLWFFPSGAVWRTKLTSNCQTEEEQIENIHKENENISAEQKRKPEHLCQCEECLCVEGQHLQHNLWSVKCNYFIILVYVTSHQLYWFRQQNSYSTHSRHTGCCKAQCCEQVNMCKNFPVCGINMVRLLLHAYSIMKCTKSVVYITYFLLVVSHQICEHSLIVYVIMLWSTNKMCSCIFVTVSKLHISSNL